MAHPRKRRCPVATNESTASGPPFIEHRTTKRRNGHQAVFNSQVQHPVLSHYYPQVQSLRQYVTAKLPSSSKLRQKKVATVGIRGRRPNTPISDVEQTLGALLDRSLVGLSDPEIEGDSQSDELKGFSRVGDESYVTLSNGVAGFAESQAMIVEYVVRTVFDREKSVRWPDHLLCNGFSRNGGPGLRIVRPNSCVKALQQSPWPQLLALLGESGDNIMIDLLLNCALFVCVDTDANNVCQISGKPLSSIPSYPSRSTSVRTTISKPPSELSFVRNRMFYAKPALNTRGQVSFGFRHIHVLNRSPFQQPSIGQNVEMQSRLTRQNGVHTLRVMMYMFPRQFGLHNVFTSTVDPRETSHRLKDYTSREDEIFQKFGRLDEAHTKTPKRLRGASNLVQKLQILHQRCSYSRLLQHYCPVRPHATNPDIQAESYSLQGQVRHLNSKSDHGSRPRKPVRSLRRSENTSIVDLASSPAEVSSFCRATLRKIIPREFWGNGPVAEQNENIFLNKVDTFICLRRFESLSLHESFHGMKMTDIEWLAPSPLLANKTSLTDFQKRLELFSELLYFLFDSIVIPLVRGHFYVTESNTDKYRIFFFRHDVWRSLIEPAMANLKGKMLEEVSIVEAKKILDSRRLGYSQIRLLPKGVQMRPIMNLRRRALLRGSSKQLGPGINTILAPAHTVFQLEKAINPQKLGSAMFCVGDIYERMKSFKLSMSTSSAPYYFAKVDVQSAFDTIPQAAIVKLLQDIPQQSRYHLAKYLEVGPSFTANEKDGSSTSRPMKRWPSVAVKDGEPTTLVEGLGNGRSKPARNTVFVDLYQKPYEKNAILQLVTSHIQHNLVKVGKKYYRQKQGIPQGSVLSATLCNYFYADLESRVLPFLCSEESLLLRLIDDFLLVTTDKGTAIKFINTLHSGVPDYGVTVNPKKSLINFDHLIDNQRVPKLGDGERFPYCGTLIDTRTLDIARASHVEQKKGIFDSLTVEFGRKPGQTFQRKVLNAFKIQSHLMFFDTELNSAITMLNNLHRAFVETATKMWAYARCLPFLKHPPQKIIIETIQKLADTAYALLVSKVRRVRHPGYVCDVKRCEVSWLAYNAFYHVLSRRQSKYSETLAWLETETSKLSMLKDIRHARVQTVVYC